LSMAKVLLHTQPSEAFGMVVVEAMAAGCVPVVPRSGGPWIDILDRRQGVYGFAYRNIDEAANIIRMLLSNEELRREVAGRARVRALCFNKSIFEEKVLGVMKMMNLMYLAESGA
ncbi:MAG: glycosyltransferase, partial [Candidatus Bathyarchaeia archaeon]